jgi:hypothetical protein
MIYLLLLACKAVAVVDSGEPDSATPSPYPQIETQTIQAASMFLYDVAFTSERVLVSCPYCAEAQVFGFDPDTPPADLGDSSLRFFAGSEFTEVGLRLPQGEDVDTVWIGAKDASSGMGVGHVLDTAQFPDAGEFSIPQSATDVFSDGKARSNFGVGALWARGHWYSAAVARGSIPPTMYEISDGEPYIFGPVDACSAQVHHSCAVDRVFVQNTFWYTANGGLLFRFELQDEVASAFKFEGGAISYIPNSSAVEDDQIITRMATSHDDHQFVGTWRTRDGLAVGGMEFYSTPTGGTYMAAYSRDSGVSAIGDYVIYGAQETQSDGSLGGYRIEMTSGEFEGEVFDFSLSSENSYYCPAPVVKTDGGERFAVICEFTEQFMLLGRVH